MSQKTVPEPQFLPDRMPPVWQGGLIVLLVVLAYLPALHGGFIWDDDAYVTNNPLLAAPDGLRQIWFSQNRPRNTFPSPTRCFALNALSGA